MVDQGSSILDSDEGLKLNNNNNNRKPYQSEIKVIATPKMHHKIIVSWIYIFWNVKVFSFTKPKNSFQV